MKDRASNLILATTIGALVFFVLRMLLRESVVVVERMDRLAREQAARHAYGPLTLVQPENAAVDLVTGNDAIGSSDPATTHRFAGGPRPWDDDQLGKDVDPLDRTIDDPFSADGQIMQPRFINFGGQVETDT